MLREPRRSSGVVRCWSGVHRLCGCPGRGLCGAPLNSAAPRPGHV